MKNIKEIIIGVFAVIGFVAIVSGFTTNNATQETTHGTPERHVWEMQGEGNGRTLVINKVTGEVKAYVFKVGSTQTVGVKAYTPKEALYGDKG